MKRRSIAMILVLALTLLFAVQATAGPVLNSIVAKGELVVATSGDQPPLTITTKEGKIIGLDVDLAKLMASNMGVRLRLEVMPFGQLLPALEGGKVDMIMSGMTMTPERNLKVVFVGPYYISGKGILTKIQTIAALQNAEDINKPDFTVAALKGSTSQLFAEKAVPKAKLIITESLDEAVRLVLKDKVNALIADYPFCVVSAFRHQGKGLVAGEARFTVEPLGIALPASDLLFVNWVQNFVKTLEWSGELTRLTKRWFKDASWVKKLP